VAESYHCAFGAYILLFSRNIRKGPSASRAALCLPELTFVHRYVEALEQKLQKFEGLIRRVSLPHTVLLLPVSTPWWQLHPTDDFTREIGIPLTRDNWMLEGVLGDSEAVTIPAPYNDPDSAESSFEELDEMDGKLETLTKDMTRLHVGSFRGKSSGAAIVQATLDIRQEVSGVPSTFGSFMQIKRPEYWEIRDVRPHSLSAPCSLTTARSGRKSSLTNLHRFSFFPTLT
jgi:hypothetical protein